MFARTTSFHLRMPARLQRHVQTTSMKSPRRSVIAATSAVVLAVVSATCADGKAGSFLSASPLAPSAVVASAGDDVNGTQARGGNGGGKPGGGGTSGSGTLALVMVTDNNGNGAPNWGETISFTVTTSETKPFVELKCYQGSQVYGASVGFFDAYPWEKSFLLSSGAWSSGAATCTAKIYTSVDGTSLTYVGTPLDFNVGA